MLKTSRCYRKMASRYETKEELETRLALEKAALLEEQKLAFERDLDAILDEVEEEEVADLEKENSDEQEEEMYVETKEDFEQRMLLGKELDAIVEEHAAAIEKENTEMQWEFDKNIYNTMLAAGREIEPNLTCEDMYRICKLFLLPVTNDISLVTPDVSDKTLCSIVDFWMNEAEKNKNPAKRKKYLQL